MQANLLDTDIEVKQCLDKELKRQKYSIELIASENIVSQSVLEAQGSVLTNKYAEGYPGKRYYGGCKHVDKIESIAIERAKKLYSAQFANVQPHSGSQANQAVFLALLKPYDKIMSLSLNCGGHLTHGSNVNLSGKWFQIFQYSLDKKSHLLNYEEISKLSHDVQPKLIIAGGSAYPRKIDFAKFREIADSVGAYLMVDMAHISGIIAAGFHQNPIEYADVVTSTTHKTLRGPRGGIILTNHEYIARKVDSAVFPGMQGGPLLHVIAAKAVAFAEASSSDFTDYIRQVLKNAVVLSGVLASRGYYIITGGTDTHLLLVDLRKQKITGKLAEEKLEEVGITCNKNSIPFDEEKPFVTSGIRLGTAAGTTRGFKEEEFIIIANLIADILDDISRNQAVDLQTSINAIKIVKHLCRKFPIYGNN